MTGTEVTRLMQYVRDYVPARHIIANGGDDGQAFLIFDCLPEQLEPYAEQLLELAQQEGYENAYWCPEPDTHLDDAREVWGDEIEDVTVLNLFR